MVDKKKGSKEGSQEQWNSKKNLHYQYIIKEVRINEKIEIFGISFTFSKCNRRF